MAADNTGGLLMARRGSRVSVNMAIGWLVFRMLMLATSLGSNFKRNANSSRPTVADTKWRARRRRAKGLHCCKAAPSAVVVEGTYGSAMRRDGEGRKLGMSA